VLPAVLGTTAAWLGCGDHLDQIDSHGHITASPNSYAPDVAPIQALGEFIVNSSNRRTLLGLATARSLPRRLARTT
jgi:hypothetical protein